MTAVVLRGDAREIPLPDESADLIVTSPPYFGLRSYTDGGEHYAGQAGAEATPAAYVAALVACTREWVRVLKPSGSLFVNLGDKYSSGAGPHTGQKSEALRSSEHGHGGGRKWAVTPRQPAAAGWQPKSLLGLPWRYALACTDQLGLILRAEIIWDKPNGLPESVTDRIRRSHEQVFHFTRQPRYYAAVDNIREPHAEVSIKRAMPHRANPGRRDAAVYNGQPSQTLALAQMNNPLGKLPGSVWNIASQPLTVPAHLGVDHFAAFPMELPRRIILGWSPPGICTACGEGRSPVVDKVTSGHDNSPLSRTLRVNGGMGGTAFNRMKALGGGDHITGYACDCTPYTEHPLPGEDWLRPWREYHLEGWTAPPSRPAVVLDPFGGTGTTALVASTHGRTGISIDMSADYCRIARWRTRDPGERCRSISAPKPPPQLDGQDSLFEDGAA